MEKTLKSPLNCKEIQPVNPKGNQSWVFTVRTDVEAETPILWTPDAKSWLIWEDPDPWKDWEQEEKGTKQDEMVRWHHQLKWTWVWLDPGSWWWAGRPGMLRFMGMQRVWHDWATELNWTELNAYIQNLEKWYWRIYLQGDNGETDIENRFKENGERGGEGEMYGKNNMETYITCVK